MDNAAKGHVMVNNALTRLDALLIRFSIFMHKIGTIFFLSSLVIIITVDVFLRYVFSAPITGGSEINGLLLILVFFLSLNYCWDEDGHIRVEFIYEHLKGGVRLFSDIMTGVAGMAFSGLLCYKYIIDLPYVIRTHESGPELQIPVWPFKTIISLCCLIFFIKLSIYIIMNIMEFKNGVRKWA